MANGAWLGLLGGTEFSTSCTQRLLSDEDAGGKGMSVLTVNPVCWLVLYGPC